MSHNALFFMFLKRYHDLVQFSDNKHLIFVGSSKLNLPQYWHQLRQPDMQFNLIFGHIHKIKWPLDLERNEQNFDMIMFLKAFQIYFHFQLTDTIPCQKYQDQLTFLMQILKATTNFFITQGKKYSTVVAENCFHLRLKPKMD